MKHSLYQSPHLLLLQGYNKQVGACEGGCTLREGGWADRGWSTVKDHVTGTR